MIALNVRAPTEDYAAALADARRVAAAAREAGALAALPIALSVAADAAYRLGRWDIADADATELLAVADATGQRMPLVHALGVLARLRASRGDATGSLEAAERALAIGLPSRIGSMSMFAVAARGFLELGRGDMAAALGPLERCEQMAEISGLAEPHLVPWAPDLIETLRPLGPPGGGRAPAGLARGGGAHRRHRDRPRARRPLPRARRRRRFDEHFLDALRHHDVAPTPFERARTQLAYGSRLQRDGRRREARTHLHAAARLLRGAGRCSLGRAGPDRARAARGRRRDRSEGLTPGEDGSPAPSPAG